ncbi:MAG: tetratricopeptide repeat protein [Nostoc sp.]
MAREFVAKTETRTVNFDRSHKINIKLQQSFSNIPIDDKGWEASTLNNIGIVYDSLGEKQEALKYYNQALPIFRAVGDRKETSCKKVLW